MATYNFFTNENPSVVQNTTGNYGIISHAIDPTKIVDGLTGNGAGLGKLGSSIPSPLARLFLFSAALSEVNSYEGNPNKQPGEGHDGLLNEQTGKIEPTAYHYLVSELLDMLEFVFLNGDHPDFHVHTWTVKDDCTLLDNSGNSAHKNLSAALRDAFSFGVMKDNTTIHLFTWGDAIIGGSSPLSLVYTSANLRSTLANIPTTFLGVAGNKLFDDNTPPMSLHRRDTAFREYLYRLHFTDMQGIASDHPLHHLKKYIQDSGSTYDSQLYGPVQQTPEAYKNVKELQSQGAGITVAGVQLRVSDHSFDPATSGYVLAPTSDVYKHGNDKPIPLALTKHGVPGLIYAHDREWKSDSDVIPAAPAPDIYDRQLPSLAGQYYPYLTVADFFEEKVIELSYNVNSARFYMGANDIPFLLPLKKIFFEYFNAEDLATMLTITYDKQRGAIHMDLTLPLVHGKTITMHKKYDVSDNSTQKVNCVDGENTLALAIFPFYRLAPALDENVYNVMLGASAQQVGVSFYEPANTAEALTAKECAPKQRMVKGKNGAALSTYHYHVDGAFTFCEVTVAGTAALVVPQFQKITSDASEATQRFTFAFDFGTTNTHAAYATTPGRYFGSNDIKAFTYDANDPQVVTLDGKDGIGEFNAFPTVVKRELVPPTIGSNDGNNTVAFPMRTATYQSPGTPNRLEMFVNTNIGFNYGGDISQMNSYKTNIKWDRADHLVHDRMKTFFAQMLWMMKNKSVLNDGSATFSLVVTYPYSMRASDVQKIKDAWEAAKKEVHCTVDITYRTESVTPYYSYLLTLNYSKPYVNIDIGGGTTDFLYVNPRQKGDNHVFSAFFAANDLWKDGLVPQAQADKANGFLTYYTKKKIPLPEILAAELKNVKDKAASSADIIDYLFTHDHDMRFSDTIVASTTMKQLPVVHFSAIAFYLAYALHMAGVDIPSRITFTGMGSKYIHLISAADSDISSLLTAIFHYAGKVLNNNKLRAAKLSVTFAASPKEVTAEGALLSLHSKSVINPAEDVYFGYETEEPGKTMHYGDITDGILKGVADLYEKFLGLFAEQDYLDELGRIRRTIDSAVVQQLRDNYESSMLLAKEQSSDQQAPTDKFSEPMFFWPLKDALYVVGKKLA